MHLPGCMLAGHPILGSWLAYASHRANQGWLVHHFIVPPKYLDSSLVEVLSRWLDLLQQNGHDCGLFVMKYMESLSEGNEPMKQFDPIEASLEFVGKIVTHDSNKAKPSVMEGVKKQFEITTTLPSTWTTKPVLSPSKSPGDSQFSTVKARSKNMWTEKSNSPKTHHSKRLVSSQK
uniref:Ubiquitin-like protease family profile domain-containing protein n=1 Tax=Cannabis sativa TaxID=3483 RepID=A0A803PCZ4_CANSA